MSTLTQGLNRKQAKKRTSSLTNDIPPPSDFLSFLASPLTAVHHLLTSPTTHMNVLRLSLVGFLGLASIIVAVVSYGMFYVSWGRVRGWEKDVQLYYGTPNSPPHTTVHIPFPTSIFSENQPYDVYFDLSLPLSPSNLDLGNFMVSLSLQPLPSPSTTSLLSPSSPPSSLYNSTLTTLLSPPLPISLARLRSLFFGVPKRTMTFKMLEGVVLVPSYKKSGETVGSVMAWVGREDLWRSQREGDELSGGRGKGKEVVTYGGRVRFVGKLSGIRYILYSYPLLSLLTFTTTTLFTTLFIALSTFYLLSPSSPVSSPSIADRPITSSSSSPTTPTTPFTAADATTLNLSRSREKEWAASLPRSMGSITGEADLSDSDASLSNAAPGEREFLQRQREVEELEAEERELGRLRAKEEDRIMREEEEFQEQERLKRRAREEEEEASEQSEGSSEGTVGGRAVRVKKEEIDEDERSLLGGSGTASSTKSFGASSSSSRSSMGSGYR